MFVNKKKIYVVIGTRGQLIKMAPLMRNMQQEGIDYEFIYTSQHRETIDKLIGDFQIKNPDKIIYSGFEANTRTKFLRWWLRMISKALSPKEIFRERGVVLTHGDTVTTAWAAIVGKLAGSKVAHVEAGLRSFNLFKPFPEELMRLITFHFSDVYFCPNEWAINNLKKYKGDKVNLGMNTLYDSVKIAINSNVRVDIPKEKYAVVSIHRFENIFTGRFENVIIPLLEMVSNEGFTLVFILHPPTREVLKKNHMKLYKRLQNNKKILLKERYSYFEFIKLLNGSEFVITDGGSNQEELSYLGKPALLFREVTERIEGLGENVVISSFDTETVMEFLKKYKEKQTSFKKVNESPSQVIVNYLKTL